MISTYRLPLDLNSRPPEPVDSGFYADIQFDTDDSAPIYIGLHLVKGAADTDVNWKIYKFFYSGSNVTRIQLAYGAWASRASLF